ncbi:expressed unknown protein [Seminavis robusta]|uniref:Uncharacterized protein n=1 Tax=Seminavis robusta TaxID=568900 RepID=A0A9N8E3W0_9STRA|nr:expressed unknown protein [Seminavis robusta]|eukprot:Sro591_g172010.1 n/a (112) ;mRNA; f:28786-29121
MIPTMILIPCDSCSSHVTTLKSQQCNQQPEDCRNARWECQDTTENVPACPMRRGSMLPPMKKPTMEAPLSLPGPPITELVRSSSTGSYDSLPRRPLRQGSYRSKSRWSSAI